MLHELILIWHCPWCRSEADRNACFQGRGKSILAYIHLLSGSGRMLQKWTGTVGGELFPRNLLTHFNCWPRDFGSFS